MNVYGRSDEAAFRELDILDWELETADGAFSVHNACWYPAKLLPQIAAPLVLNLTAVGDTVWDPFCGSGTTSVEALRHGRRCIGTDVSPVAIYISQAKCRLIDMEELRQKYLEVHSTLAMCGGIIDVRSRHGYAPTYTCEELLDDPLGRVPNRDENAKWFHPKVLEKLSILKTLVWCQYDQGIRDVLGLAFFSILRDCSSLPIERPYTYIADNVTPKDLLDKDVVTLFRQRAEKILTGRQHYQSECDLVRAKFGLSVADFNNWMEFTRADAREAAGTVQRPVDCIITSPPYMGVTDTTTGHRLWYLWHDFGTQIERDKSVEIGPRWKRRTKTLEEEYVRALDGCFGQMRQILKPGRYLCMILGIPQRASQDLGDRVLHAIEHASFKIERMYNRDIHKKWFVHPSGGVAQEIVIVARG